jgi:hypothetical protein
MKGVRFAARDPGAANVVAAFLGAFSSGAARPYDVWTLPRATPVFARQGIVAREFDDVDAAELRAAWSADPAAALVTGTSHYAAFEPTLWALARESGAPSLAVLDSWMNLDRRFSAGRPDWVGAVDGAQVAELRALGFSAEQILVSGHPFLSALEARVRTARPPAPHPGSTEVLFISEPIASDVEAGVNAPFGFTELDAFAVLHAAAVEAAIAGAPSALAVKLHPYEDPTRFLALVASLGQRPGVDLQLVPRADRPEPWLARADLVVGISSMLLLEAIAARRPVISLQPGLRREETFIAARRGHVETLTDPAQARAVLGTLIASPEARAQVAARNAGFLAAVAPLHTAEVTRWIERSLDGPLARA